MNAIAAPKRKRALFAAAHPPETQAQRVARLEAVMHREVPQLTKAPKRKRSSAKGALLETRAAAILEAQGYKVDRAGKVLIWIAGQPRTKQHDYFGAADLMALPRKGVTRYIQVSTFTNRSHKRKQMQPLADHADVEHVSCEVWCWVGGRKPAGQRFRVQEWNASGEWADAKDEVCE